MWRVWTILSACLLAATVEAQPASLSPDQVEEIRRVAGQELSQDGGTRALRYRHAQSSFRSGRYAAARHYLQYLLRTSPSARDLQDLLDAYATVVRASPWAFDLNLSILPSTNINKTSSNEVFHTALGPLRIIGGGDEESGTGLRYGAEASYETPLSSDTFLTYGLELNRSHYPSDRLNSIDATARLTWSIHSLRGLTTVTPYVTRLAHDFAEGESPNSTRYGLRLGYEHHLTADRSIAGAVTSERREQDEKEYLEGSFFSISVSSRTLLSKSYRLRLQAGLSANRPLQEHLRYDGLSLSGELTRSVRTWGTLGASLGTSMRAYEGDFPALGKPRSDHAASVGLSFRSTAIRLLDSSPRVSCRAQQNWSNVALYEYRSTDCAITFERNF